MKKHGKVVDKCYVKKEKESQRLKMGGGSWSINLEELTDDTRAFKYISEKGTYTISLAKAEDVGFRRVLGGEQKLVVPIKEWHFERREKS